MSFLTAHFGSFFRGQKEDVQKLNFIIKNATLLEKVNFSEKSNKLKVLKKNSYTIVIPKSILIF